MKSLKFITLSQIKRGIHKMYPVLTLQEGRISLTSSDHQSDIHMDKC